MLTSGDDINTQDGSTRFDVRAFTKYGTDMFALGDIPPTEQAHILGLKSGVKPSHSSIYFGHYPSSVVLQSQVYIRPLVSSVF
jgi:hypothetical protein